MHARGDKSHWHGEHPTGRQRDGRYIEWIRKFDALAVAAKERGQHIVNCTPDSALKCFENDDLTIF